MDHSSMANDSRLPERQHEQTLSQAVADNQASNRDYHRLMLDHHHLLRQHFQVNYQYPTTFTHQRSTAEAN